MSKYLQKLSRYSILIIAIFAGFANLLFLDRYNLHPDEAYYWVWSRHLAIGYFDNSPLVAYIIRLFTAIGGNNEFWVRVPAFLGWVGFIILVYIFTKEVYRDDRPAWLGVLLAVFVPLVATGSHLMTPDIPMIFFASITWYFLYRAIEQEQKTAWYWVGLFFGLALFSKFQAVLIGLATLVMLLSRPTKRKILGSKEPYIAVLIGFIFFIPVLYWNWQHHWAAFLWQSQHGIHQQLNLNSELEYIAGQLGVFSPLLFLALIYYTIKRLFWRKGTTSSAAFLIGCFLPVFIFFGFSSLTISAAPNWPAVGYLPAIVFLAGELAHSWQGFNRFKRVILTLYLGCALVLSIFLLTFVRYPEFLIRCLRIDLSADQVVTNQTYGWNQLGHRVDEIISSKFGTSNQPVPVFGDSYQTAAELQFYVSSPVTVFTTRQAHRNHYDFITAAKILQYDKKPGLLVLGYEVPANASWYFQGIELADILTFTRFNKPVRKLYLYRFRSLDAKALYDMAVNKPYGFPGTYPN